MFFSFFVFLPYCPIQMSMYAIFCMYIYLRVYLFHLLTSIAIAIANVYIPHFRTHCTEVLTVARICTY